jgi:uncharacterized membrane protein YkvA (DUF1232 family)
MANKEPKGFKKAEKKTKELLGNKKKLAELIASAQKKGKAKREKLKGVWTDFHTLLRLLKAYRSKKYSEVPWRTILYAATAIFYFVSPLDLIPDFIPLTGFLDDITVITFVIGSIQEDLQKFKSWELEQNEELNE